jgi:hypothetical protein
MNEMELTSRGIVRHGDGYLMAHDCGSRPFLVFLFVGGLDVGGCEEELELFSYPGFCARLGWGVWGCEAVVALAGRSLKKKREKEPIIKSSRAVSPGGTKLGPEALTAGV